MLGENKTDQRLSELAIGLAYWASRYQPLPAGEDEFSKTLSTDPGVSLMLIERLPEKKRISGLIFNRVEPLARFLPFLDSFVLLDCAHPAKTLSKISQTAAALYLQNPDRPAITFIHCLTATHSVRMIAPYLKKEDVPMAINALWRVVAALYCSDADADFMGVRGYALTADEEKMASGFDRMINLAAMVTSDHVVKYAWSVAEENKIAPDPVYAAALARWLVSNKLSV